MLLASYLVTRNKTYRYAFAGFLFYFFDVALVFQDDFLMQRASDASVSPFFIGSPVASVLVGGGALISFWLVLCESTWREDRPAVRWIPGAAFVLASFAVLLLAPRATARCSCSTAWREAMLYAMLVYLAARYRHARRRVTASHAAPSCSVRRAYGRSSPASCLRTSCSCWSSDPHAIAGQRLPFFPERASPRTRSCCAAASPPAERIGAACRYDAPEPPTQGRGASLETFIDQNLAAYAAARQLIEARGRGAATRASWARDNQNIATSMHLAPSTRQGAHAPYPSRRPSGLTAQGAYPGFWEFS